MSRENDEQVHGLYVYTPLEDVLSVENVISFHYYEYARHYIGFMESHDFWEMVYVNSGTIQCNAGSQTMELGQGQAIFHPPMEQHQLVSVGKDSSIFIISFTNTSWKNCCYIITIMFMIINFFGFYFIQICPSFFAV